MYKIFKFEGWGNHFDDKGMSEMCAKQSPLSTARPPLKEKVFPAPLQKLVGVFLSFHREILREFLGPQKKGSKKFQGKYRSIFRKKARSRPKNKSCQNSLCRRATLRKGV